MEQARVLLISMPFGPLVTPSLALSTIKPILEEAGFSTSVLYYSIDFAEHIGLREYHLIASGLPRAHDLIGEYIFSQALYGPAVAKPTDFLRYLANQLSDTRTRDIDPIVNELLTFLEINLERIVDLADQFIKSKAKEIAAMHPRIVGFTTTFQQNVASLAIAKRIKQFDKNIKIVFGGANCDGQMGRAIFSEYKFVDAVVSGEAESIVAPLFSYLAGISVFSQFIGVHVRTKTVDWVSNSGTPPVSDMDQLPTPNYSDYFSRIENINLPERPRLVFETSRGCWWGEKSHCTFCGLNGATMKFRSKSASKAIEQFREIVFKYKTLSICMTDNILASDYIKTLMPELEILNSKVGLDLFYEVKANLRRDEINSLAKAGVNRIQPGIESLSTTILRLMKKGTNCLQNIQLLKWCREFGIEPEWNFLWGFPGEPAGEYEIMAGIVDRITHLRAPTGMGPIRLDRFSPNFTNSDGKFSGIKPFDSYYLIHPLPADTVSKIAYYFEGEGVNREALRSYTKNIRDALIRWRRVSAESYLFYFQAGPIVTVIDTRARNDTCQVHVLSGALATLISVGEKAVSLEHVFRSNSQYSASDLEDALERLDELQLICREGDRYLALPILANERYPGNDVWARVAGINISNTKEAPLPSALLS